jgi:hypothetical protein
MSEVRFHLAHLNIARMRAPLEAFGGRLTKTYRMYEKPLDPVRSQARI